MTFVAVAIGGSALLGAGASIISGSKAAGAQRDAAAQSTAVQQAQIAETRRQYDQSRTDLAPYRSVGTGALYQLSDLMGIKQQPDATVGAVGGGQNYGRFGSDQQNYGGFVAPQQQQIGGGQQAGGPDYNAYLAANPDVLAGYNALAPADKAQFPTPQSYAAYHYQTYGQSEGRQAPAQGQVDPNAPTASGVANGDVGSLSRKFTLADFNTSPGYAFRQSEGQKGVENSAASRGGVLSGGAVKAISRYNSDYSASEYNNEYNRFNQDQTTRFNRLSALAGTGQTATQSGIQAGQALTQANQNSANQISSNINAAGNATASQYAGVGNAVNNQLNGFANYIGRSGFGGSGGGFTPAVSGATADSITAQLFKPATIGI